MGVFAQLDKAMLIKRMRDGKAKKRARGEFAGGRRPFGMGGTPEQTEREQHVLAYIRAMASEGLPLSSMMTPSTTAALNGTRAPETRGLVRTSRKSCARRVSGNHGALRAVRPACRKGLGVHDATLPVAVVI
ncbi:hypothetical protein [Microbacterium resistens]